MIVGRDRKICIALRTNQIAGFIAVFLLETKLEGLIDSRRIDYCPFHYEVKP